MVETPVDHKVVAIGFGFINILISWYVLVIFHWESYSGLQSTISFSALLVKDNLSARAQFHQGHNWMFEQGDAPWHTSRIQQNTRILFISFFL